MSVEIDGEDLLAIDFCRRHYDLECCSDIGGLDQPFARADLSVTQGRSNGEIRKRTELA